MWAFASKMCSADAKSERLLYEFVIWNGRYKIQKVNVCLQKWVYCWYCWWKMWEFVVRDEWEWCWWKMWAFASEVSSADAKCEDLSYETGDKMEILGVCVKK